MKPVFKQIRTGLLVSVFLLLGSMGAAQAQNIQLAGGAATGSWFLDINFVGPWDFDQMIWVHRPDLDMGGGRFESPFMDSFGGLGGAGWGVDSASPSVIQASGPSLNGIATDNTMTALSQRTYFDGDIAQLTGFDIGVFEGGAFAGGYQIEISLDQNIFAVSGLTEAQFASDLAAVPEPGTLGLLGLGLVGFSALRRRRRRS